jgi:uncharacterized protein YndB with AHSA1/START domain
MSTSDKIRLTVLTTINAPVEKVWDFWTNPFHILHWNNASDDWQTTYAENDLKAGGRFLSRMEAKDGSMGFDFTGEYTRIDFHQKIESLLDDGRSVELTLIPVEKGTTVKEVFEAEQENTPELQQKGWQAILDNFRHYVESNGSKEFMHFETSINASANKVFKTMIDEKTYREWTKEFNPTSYFKGTWQKGSKIVFLGTDSKGNQGGMVSKIKEIIPDRFISIENLGIIQNGIEIMCGPEVDSWAGSLENYTFIAVNDKTIISIDIDSNQEFRSYFEETWPKALEKLKAICENQ